jgi:hypothetical protein
MRACDARRRDPVDGDGLARRRRNACYGMAAVDKRDDPAGHVLIGAGQALDFNGHASLLGDLADDAFLEGLDASPARFGRRRRRLHGHRRRGWGGPGRTH